MTIADRIKNKRIELELSQTELAKRAGYSDKTAISRYEHSGDDISMKQIRRIAEALGVSSSYLMGWETEDGERTIVGQLYDAYTDGTRIPKAMELYTMYATADPEIQRAVELLLKSAQQHPESPDKP